jgi:hypothetical protein
MPYEELKAHHIHERVVDRLEPAARPLHLAR